MSEQARIAFIGGGNMARSLIGALVRGGTPADAIAVAEPNAELRALLARPDARDVFAAIRCPTLLLCGREDTWAPLARHQRMREVLPHAWLVAVEECGHMSPMEQPQAVAMALAQWLAAG